LARFVCIVKEWQTLIAGMSAVFATALGAYLLWRQTAQTKHNIEDVRIRSLDKARTLAQFELSTLTGAINLYVSEIQHVLMHKTRASPAHFGGWPKASLDALANIQMHCQTSERQQFGELFRHMQVLEARLEGLKAGSYKTTFAAHQSWLLNACMLAQVKSAIDSLFPYCRFEHNTFPDFDQHLTNIENTFSFWSIDLVGDPEDQKSDVSCVRRWLARTYTKQVVWPIRIPVPK
jgi:hypothetical protein